MATKRREESGAAMVEFAIVLPVLLMILVAIIEFGIAYHAQLTISAAAREGARELALRHDAATVAARVREAASPLELDAVAQTPCPATGDGQARVQIRESFTFGIPFVPLGTKTLSATGVMRCGL